MNYKIAFLEDDTADGGLGMVFRRLAKELSDENEILYISHRKEKTETSSFSRYIPLRFDSSVGEEVNGIKKCLSGVLPLVKVLKQEKPDIVISFGFYSNVRLCLAGRFCRKTKILISERGNAKRYKGLVRLIVNTIFNRTDGFVFQSRAAQRCFTNKIQEKSHVIYNAVFKPIPKRVENKRSNVIVSVGRFHPDKNFILLIDAFSKISQQYSEINLVIYGEEEKDSTLGYKELMSNEITKLKLEDRVILPGQVDDVLRKIIDSRFFVLSSDLEGMPNALVEAMACGLPIITTNFDPGNAEEFVTNNVNGLIVNKRDVDAMTYAMKKYLDNPEFADQMGHKAEVIREKLSSEKFVLEWKEYIDELCK